MKAALLCSVVYAGPLEDGDQAYDAGDYATAMKCWRPLADEGNAYAQAGLGDLYSMGLGVSVDLAKAAHYYTLASELGDAGAQCSLASICLMKETPEGRKESFGWLQKSAEQGFMAAEFNLALHYESGWGTPKDKAQAALWYRKAYEHGSIAAASRLGQAYVDGGDGRSQDLVEAWVWLTLGANVHGLERVEVKLTPLQLEEAKQRLESLEQDAR